MLTPLFCCCFWIRDPEWTKIRIRDKHPGSATLVNEHQNDLYHLCGVQQPDGAAEPDTGRPGQEHQDREGGPTAGQSTIYNHITYIMYNTSKLLSTTVTHNFDRGSQKL